MGSVNLGKRRICYGSPSVFNRESRACTGCFDVQSCKSVVTLSLRENLHLSGAVEALSKIEKQNESTEQETPWSASVLKRLSRATLQLLVARGERPLDDEHPALAMSFAMLMRGGFLRQELVQRLLETSPKKTAENNATKAIKTLLALGLATMNGSRVTATVTPIAASQNNHLSIKRALK